MTAYTAMYHAVYRDTNMSLHLAGCGAIGKEQQQHDSNLEDFEADSLTEALDHMVDEELQEMGYDHDSVHVHNCAKRSNRRSRKPAEGKGTMPATTKNEDGIFTTLAELSAGQMVRPVPGTYKAKVGRTDQRRGVKPATVSFGEEWAGSRFAKVMRVGETAKKPGHYDIGFSGDRTFHAYPGTVKFEIKSTAKERKAAAKATTTTRTRKGKATEQTGAPATRTQRAQRSTVVDMETAKAVKEERDNHGTAWWQIGVKFNLPGAGPLPAGKRGAGQARKLYKAASGGSLPASARSNGGKRNTTGTPKTAQQRRRNAIGLELLPAAELKEKLEGKTIVYTYSNAELGESDPIRVVKVKKVALIGKSEKLAVTFWSERSREGFGNERTVYADQIVQVS